MKKIVILGSTGMLGSSVSDVFLNNADKEVLCSYRTEGLSAGENSFYFDATTTSLDNIPECDYIINCIGIIKPFMLSNIQDSVYINSIFPHKLADFCKARKTKLIHITTDCVFVGSQGRYHESSPHDCDDEYGKSKSLGEPKNCMVLRTSIIGEEIHKNASLIEWVKSNAGKTINGFTNHVWNGITTKHYGEICNEIIDNNLFCEDLFHLHSNDITKFELLKLINERFSLNIKVLPVEAKSIDRTLSSGKELMNKLSIKKIEQQVAEL